MFSSTRKCWPSSFFARDPHAGSPKHAAALQLDLPPELGGVLAARLRERGDGVHDERGLVALAAHRLRREVGAVGLGEDAVGRHLRRGEAQVDRLRERRVAGERDVPAALERRLEQVRRGEAVQHDRAGEVGERSERVGVGRARVDDGGLAGLGGDVELLREEAQLLVARRVVAEPVETGLPHRDRARVREQLAHLGDVGVGRVARLVRMDAEDREDVLVRSGELERAPAAGRRRCRR